MKQVKNINDIPDGHHYTVLVYKTQSIHIPGDERSRTNPGHGYPERTENINSFEHFVSTNRDEWVKFISIIETERKKFPYVALEVIGKANISIAVEVKVRL